MKTFTKKSLSVVLAMLMALSTLTAGAVTAFAKDFDLKDYTAVSVGTTSITDLEKTKYSFTPATSGYYDISLSASSKDKTVYSNFELSKVIEDYTSTVANGYAWSYEKTTITPSKVDYEGDNFEYSTIYYPAQRTVKLTAGEVYTINVYENSSAVSAALTITANESGFQYGYTTTSKEVTYISYYGSEWNETTKKYDYYPVYRTTYVDSPAVYVYSYIGKSTVVNIPAQLAGLPVIGVNFEAPTALAKRITAVSVPEGVEWIDGFSGCYALSSVNFPSTLKEIDSWAFAHCHSLAGSITIPATVEYVGSGAFYDTALSSVSVLGNETEIGERAFGYAEVLNTATADPRDTTFAVVPGFKILAPATSLAAVYAVNNGIAIYDPANCTAGNHYYSVVSTPATVFAKGSEVSTCACCGNVATKSIAKKKVKISSLKSAKKALTVKAPKYSEVKGYQIQYSTSSKFTKKTTKTVTVKTTKALSKKITGLNSGKKYYVKVRAYKTVNGKNVYSSYSAVKSVKVK